MAGNKQIHDDLIRWAEILDRVPAGNFDMDFWKKGASALCLKSMDGSCGTVACAGGWATVDPEFSRRGLQLVGNSVQINGYWCGLAIAICVGITLVESRHICCPEHYGDETMRGSITSAQVAERIRSIAMKYVG